LLLLAEVRVVEARAEIEEVEDPESGEGCPRCSGRHGLSEGDAETEAE
jgi:hypothetical protein